MMIDDDIIVNFEINDSPITVKRIFQGGKWRDRFIAKKCAAKRAAKKTSQTSNREIFSKNYLEGAEELVNGENSNAKKRRRSDQGPANPNHIVTDSKKLALYTGEKKEIEKKSDESIACQEKTKAGFISGKLPAGTININGSSKVNHFKKFDSILGQKSTSLAENSSHENITTVIGAKKIVFNEAPLTVQRDDINKKTSLNRDATNVKKGGQIISSLFSFNPTAKTKYEKPEQKAKHNEPSNAPLPSELENFTNLGLSTRLATHLSLKLSLKAPTAIQKAAIPLIIKNDDDAFIQAETGSGKTMAYLLPIVQRIIEISSQGIQLHRDSGLFAIILAPTRELCKQIATVLDKLLRCAPWIVGTTVIGGESKQSEKARIRKGINILIATPGRLLDHLGSTEVLKVDTVRWLVLDEGDRLMELGFEQELKQIVEKLNNKFIMNNVSRALKSDSLPKRRVNILCSATMVMNVQRLGEISLKDAVYIAADPTEKNNPGDTGESTESSMNKFLAPAQLRQAYTIVPAKQRLVTLAAVLKKAFARRGSVMKAIVFISCADSVDFHFYLFSRSIDKLSENEEKPNLPFISTLDEMTKDTVAHGIAISNKSNTVIMHRLHGSLTQNTRTATLKSFSTSTEPCVMFCTDVASRGLDLPNVDYVIEYDPPFCADDHLHRVGRTARAGKDGSALIFLLPGEEEEYISILASGHKEGEKALNFKAADDLLRKGFGGVGKEWEERATNWQLDVERWVQDSPKYLEMARRGFQSQIRAYATHVAGERHIFNITTLHLGHLAKAFALRDKPGNIKVPGIRPVKVSKAERNMKGRKASHKEGEEIAPEGERVRKQRKLDLDLPKTEPDDASIRMRRKVQEHMSAANEFNIV
ncbi:putative atp-dependent rna helicase dbp7 [Erysiphe necator]|uniref:ATP-dependent RNA helicase n=1 Tax=Uncinula necator TaxID=52586 RepID=A0A0B1P8T6_UNCNE|nr:putative atp-dependent rna helicase dbp7 [Erysiphe necator]